MSQENPVPIGTIALTFLAGAAVGAIVLALTTPKTGKELRGDLKDLGNRLRGRARELVDGSEVTA
ncbi:MAG TPA: YtxH domain-containing protein [Holophagaceae bacterium]|nr:YtxH domain-containing protein [Holophagaceae bacterium]